MEINVYNIDGNDEHLAIKKEVLDEIIDSHNNMNKQIGLLNQQIELYEQMTNLYEKSRQNVEEILSEPMPSFSPTATEEMKTRAPTFQEMTADWLSNLFKSK